MQPYNVQSILLDLKEWMTSRFMVGIPYLEGGWEYWIQIDFPASLDTPEMQYDFRREFPVDGGRLDWVINASYPEELTAVEIKAQTPKYLNNTFTKDLEADIARLSSLEGYKHRFMLAAVLDPGLYEKLIKQAGFSEVAIFGGVNLCMRRVEPGSA